LLSPLLWDCPHRILVPFPTRRSSDLVQQTRLDSTYREQAAAFIADVDVPAESPERKVPDEVLVRRLAADFRRGLKAGDPVGRLRIPDRKSTRLNSRSRENLVCRLLLEKKKAKGCPG